VQELLQALHREGQAGDGADLLVLTARSLFSLAAFEAAALPWPRLRWQPGSWHSRSRLYVAGWGETARIDTFGSERFGGLLDQGRALFARLHEHRAAGCDELPPPRLYGGLGFTVAPPTPAAASPLPADQPWRNFADASFALPRWLGLELEGRSYLQLAIRRAELNQPALLLAELALLERAVAAAGVPSRRGLADPVTAGGSDELLQLPLGRWTAMVEAALGSIGRGELSKVVVARRSRLTAAQPFALTQVLRRLSSDYPECLRFIFQRGESLFVGASPEKLVVRCGNLVEADALAGSCPRQGGVAAGDGADDQRSAQALLDDDKERREHQLVVAGIGAVLASVGARFESPPPPPKVRSLRNVHHLFTPLRAELQRPLHVLELLARLHPTPAVCGVPTAAAAQWIAQHEESPRGWYAAPVGWFDGRGDGAFFVAIRSAVVEQQRAWLYAGAGIVAGSDPQREYQETAAKQRAMLAALGIDR
jgi:isochorismate synthase